MRRGLVSIIATIIIGLAIILACNCNAYADFETEANEFIKDLSNFHNKMMDYLVDVQSIQNSNDVASLLLVFHISRAYKNYALFLIEEVTLLNATSKGKYDLWAKQYIKRRLIKFHEEKQIYVDFLNQQFGLTKDPTYIVLLRDLEKDISIFHDRIKKFEDNLQVLSDEELTNILGELGKQMETHNE